MNKIATILIFILTIFVTSRALLHTELFHVHDFIHGVRITEMLSGLREGQFPVRWSGNFGYGYGMPLFQFYAPLPFYVGAFFYWLTGNLIFSTKMLWFIPNVLTFIGSYLLGKKVFGRTGGIILALAYTLAPYRAVNLFVRGAISESWAMMTFPWIFYYILQMLDGTKKSISSLTIWIALLCLSHNLLTMIFLPFSALFAFLIWILQFMKVKKSANKVSVISFLKVIASYVLAVGLASFYLIPALLEKQYTQVEERILSGYFHFSQHFLYIRQFFNENWQYGGSAWGPDDDMSYFLGYGGFFLMACIGVLLFSQIISYIFEINEKNKGISVDSFGKKLKELLSKITVQTFVISGFFFVLSLYFSLQKSQWLWEILTPLQVAQFPWRFLSLASFFLAIVGAWSSQFSLIKKYQTVFIIVCAVFFLIPGWKYFQPEEYLDNSSALYYDDPERVRTEMSEILPDFIPIDVDREIAPQEETFIAEQTVKDSSIIVDRAHEKLYSATFDQPSSIEFAVAQYPGWKTFIDGEEVSYDVSDRGLITIRVPEGSHQFGVQLQQTPVRKYADIISVFSLMILLSFNIKVSVAKQHD